MSRCQTCVHSIPIFISSNIYMDGYSQTCRDCKTGRKDGYEPTYEEAKKMAESKGDCENCDYKKFTETFINGVVEVMNKNGITSVEQLSEILKGGTE